MPLHRNHSVFPNRRSGERALKHLLRLLFLMASIFVVVRLAMPKRTDLLILRAKHQVEIARGCSVFTPGILDGEHRFETAKREIFEVQRDGPLAMYDTPIGSIWYPRAAWTLPALVERTQADQYRLLSTVQPGDIVLDVGANVGTETRAALSAGAALVIAIEPEPLSVECLRRNLSAEIRDKRVVVVAKGAWDKEEIGTLHWDPANAGAASFLLPAEDRSIQATLTTVDRIVADLNLPKVDLIKIHVEGAEKKTLLGAAETIRSYHPRLAISLEHHLDDEEVLTAAARQIWPGYRVELTPCTKTFNLVHPAAALMAP